MMALINLQLSCSHGNLGLGLHSDLMVGGVWFLASGVGGLG